MAPRGPGIPEETKDAVCRDYQRGDKLLVITAAHGVAQPTIYAILAERNIPLRQGTGKSAARIPKTPESALKKPAPLPVDPGEENIKAIAILRDLPSPWRPGTFIITITSEDLKAMDDTTFTQVWSALGLLVTFRANKLKEEQHGVRQKTR